MDTPLGCRSYHSETTFDKDAVYSNTIFERDATFSEVHFGGTAYFDGMHCLLACDFGGSEAERKILFTKATFDKSALFSEMTFKDDAIFDDATFGAQAYFDQSFIDEGASFLRATFNQQAYFRKVTANQFDFTDAVFQPAGLLFYGTKFSEFRTNDFSLDYVDVSAKHTTAVRDMLQNFQAVFQKQGQAWLANEAGYQYWRLMQVNNPNSLEKLALLLVELGTGYGYRIKNILITTLVFTAVFAILFCSLNIVCRLEQSDTDEGGTGSVFVSVSGIRTVSNNAAAVWPANWRQRVWWACVYSTMMTTRWSIKSRTYAVRNGLVPSVQWVLGWFLILVITVTLINNFSVLHEWMVTVGLP